MGKQTTILDGPQMGYGPAPRRQGGVPLSTVILAIVCVVLAGLLALSIAGRHQASSQASNPSTGGSVSPSPNVEEPPRGVTDTVSIFLSAWSLPPDARDDALAGITLTDGLPTAEDKATAAKLAKTPASGAAVYTKINDKTVRAEQPLVDGSTLQLQLVFDSAAIYGWLISSVQLG